MHGAQPGGRSPKALNGPTGAQQLKPGTDSAQNSSSSYHSQAKGKKRELVVQGSDPVKRERTCRADDADSGQLRPEQMLKHEIAKITDRGGLVDVEGVEKLVQLMQPDSSEKKLDLSCRVMLANVIAVTDRFDCLTRFVHLRGLPVLDDWLQQVHKGKICDSSIPKEGDKSVDEFLLSSLRALDKLPVNLHALQTCNIGKSVNHLRTHKNSEIQKKARSLVDTWKKRVEAEMNMIDAKSGSSRGGSWPTKSVISEVSNVVGRRNGGPTEPAVKNVNIQCFASKISPAKLGSSDKFSVGSPGSAKQSPSATTAGIAITKDQNSAVLVGGESADAPITTIKEDKSSSSGQSLNNSQSCSSEYGKAVSCREDARSSTAGSMSVNKMSSRVSRNRKSSNGLHVTAVHGIQKENNVVKFSSMNKGSSSENVSLTRVTSERTPDANPVDNGNSQRLIVRLPNTARSPACSASGGSPEDVSATCSKGSPVVQLEKLENQDLKVQVRSETSNRPLSANMDTYKGKDGYPGSDDVIASSDGIHCNEQSRNEECSEKLIETSKVTCSPSGITAKSGKSIEASFSSINVLVDSCMKFSKADVTASVKDDIGMDLLASVASGEISRSEVSPSGSSGRKSSVLEESCSGNDIRLRQTDEDRIRSEDLHNEGSNNGTVIRNGTSNNSLLLKSGTQLADVQMTNNLAEVSKTAVLVCDEKTAECDEKSNSSNVDLPRTGPGPVATTPEKLPESIQKDPAVIASNDVKKEVSAAGAGTAQFQEPRRLTRARARDINASNSKFNGRSPLSGEDKNINSTNQSSKENRVSSLSEGAATCAKVEAKADEESPSCSSYNRHDDGKKTVNKLSGISKKTEDIELPCLPCTATGREPKTVKDDKVKLAFQTKQSEDQRLGLDSLIVDRNNENANGNPEKIDANGLHRGGSAPSGTPSLPTIESEQAVKSSIYKSDGAERYTCMPSHSSIPASGSDMTVKLDFDLNEGLPVDDGSSGELVKLPGSGNLSSVHLPCPLPVSVSSIVGGIPSSITVAAAAKGPFVPPENPLRIKGEPGWKGSAATSAFRPAEPRKILDMPLCTVRVPSVDNSSNKQGRPHLDFDLNIPDQRSLEEVAPQNSAATCSGSGHIEHNGGGLNLDLNRCDDSPEIGQFSVSNNCRLEIPKLPGGSSLSGRLFTAESNTSRDFDLNNGPGPDESGSEAAQKAKNSIPFLSSVPAVRMNNMELGNFSWFPPGTSYSAIGMPPVLPGRSDQNYPTLPAANPQRVMVPSGNTSFSPDLYRGPVLSSSPAVGYSPNTPFQYPGFPFETNFPLSSNSYSGVSTPYVDPLSGSPHCLPAIPSQLMGPTGMVSTHYPRPFVMSLHGSAGNVIETRTWGSQGLDLNTGPGATELDRRDERLPSALRQLPLTGSQPLADEQLKMYQMAGGMLKRKEPDGGWDGDRISYKHPPWQ